jgi:uncharacterized membrane protein YjgN (DUF898 family)
MLKMAVGSLPDTCDIGQLRRIVAEFQSKLLRNNIFMTCCRVATGYESGFMQAYNRGSVRDRILRIAMDAPTPTAPELSPVSSAEQLVFTYVKRPGLLKLTIVNFLLWIVTLTFYRFWAKTNVRKHIWSCVHVNGEPLEYTGTGIELFKGFLFVYGLFVLPYVLIAGTVSFTQGPTSVLAIVLKYAFILFVYVFWGFAIYKARKYQLSRTLWRGIRGTLVGSAMTYSLLYFGSLLAKSMSMGWATPVMNTVLAEQITNDMRFGDAAFKFKGRAGPLYPTYALCWFLTLAAIIAVIALIAGSSFLSGYFTQIFADTTSPETMQTMIGYIALAGVVLFFIFMLIIPMLWAVYIAKEMRTFATYTRFDGVPFTLNATTGSVIWLTVINLLLIVLTLTIAMPFVIQRTVKFFVDRIEVRGLVDIDRIRQSQVKLDKRGEGLADIFDIGSF